jgi:16S rRNA (cytosine1402-N4)-methyltransferase
MEGHVPVMRDEVLAAVADLRAGVVADCTLGLGGHAEAILDATPPGVRLIGLDRDPGAIAASTVRLARFGSRFMAVHAAYDAIPGILGAAGLRTTDRLLADLGLSSVQLAGSRAFSFADDCPLDMRFDPTSGSSAAEVLRRMAESDLAQALRELGEVPRAGRLARRIKDLASVGRMETAADLAMACREVLGPRVRGMASPTLPFQVVRILTNGELDRLDALLSALPEVLSPGGRAVFISYQSGEDGRVKRAFRALAARGGFFLPARKPLRPGPGEVSENRRSRAAKLRLIQRDEEAGP